jgi:hypothetical protein
LEYRFQLADALADSCSRNMFTRRRCGNRAFFHYAYEEL